MPLVAVEGCKCRCSHGMGRSTPKSSRPFLRIGGSAVLTVDDMAYNFVSFCPNLGPTVKPCDTTLPLVTGRSAFVFANDSPIVFDLAQGGTDGVPPGVTTWAVIEPGQTFVRAGS
ncbi:MAG: hypothetical protein KF914_17385 [Rhizobiaceae bacterium]|nr:hypothetical protein [Rhizobiaceae bacterium]